MTVKLKDRIESYKNQADYKLMSRLPIIISINGRSFSKTTQLLDKPYCKSLNECLMSTMLRLCTDIEGSIFAYLHSDQIIVVCKNDQNEGTTMWFDGRIQKIASASAGIATVHFNDCATAISLNLTNDPIFTAQVFNTPNITETVNTIIYEQQKNFYNSIQFACIYELLKKHDKNTIKEILNGLSIDEKKDLLTQECNIDYNDYPEIFRKGSACYRTTTELDNIVKNRWFINDKLPVFTKEPSFLQNIIR